MRLVLVSNRLPFTVSHQDGRLEFKHSSGGLTTGLWSYLQRIAENPETPFDFLWLGWPGASVEPACALEVETYAKKFRAAPVFLSAKNAERFYSGFCNRTLWPLFHYFPGFAQYDESDWDEYRLANQSYADALAQVLRPDDL